VLGSGRDSQLLACCSNTLRRSRRFAFREAVMDRIRSCICSLCMKDVFDTMLGNLRDLLSPSPELFVIEGALLLLSVGRFLEPWLGSAANTTLAHQRYCVQMCDSRGNWAFQGVVPEIYQYKYRCWGAEKTYSFWPAAATPCAVAEGSPFGRRSWIASVAASVAFV
jgi:hypothetical protein